MTVPLHEPSGDAAKSAVGEGLAQDGGGSVMSEATDLKLETAKTILDCTRSDLTDENDRMATLDVKLTSLAAFAGLSLSIGGSIGGTVVANQRLSLGFTIALGSMLAIGAIFFLTAVLFAFRGLHPRPYERITEKGAADRVQRERFREEPAAATWRLTSTYATRVFPGARKANNDKVRALKRGYGAAVCGLGALLAGLLLTIVGAALK